MTPFERAVRAEIYRQFAGGEVDVGAAELARARAWDRHEVERALESLQAQHRISLAPGSHQVAMAHPFAGIDTGYRAHIDSGSWFANCAWDALAIVALLGHGDGRASGRKGDIDWMVEDGLVSPTGLVHLLVPARHFWDDIGFT